MKEALPTIGTLSEPGFSFSLFSLSGGSYG